ncbi:MAG: PEGA domain-containing protein [Planctomycetes bacterium]|nr:PEGA domain-containing protein [Planctomycetota bacterium]
MRKSRALTTLCCLFTLFVLGGCVERKIAIESDPAGADVWMDGKYLGKTPVSVPFTFYGGREIRLEKEGYQAIRVLHNVNPPLFEYFPVDLASECIVPVNLRDVKSLRFDLERVREADVQGLVERADALRFQTRVDVAPERAAPVGKQPPSAEPAPQPPPPLAEAPTPAAGTSRAVAAPTGGPDRSSRR